MYLHFIYDPYGLHNVNSKLNNIFAVFTGLSLSLSQLLIELQSSSKKQKNPYGQIMGGGDTFQSSSYHTFPLKPVCVKTRLRKT